MADNVETAIYRLQVEGQAKLGELKSHVDGLAAAVEKGDNKNRKYSEGLQTTIGKSDATTRAYENMRKALESYEKYAESGKGTQQQLAAYYDITNQKIAVQEQNLKSLAAAQAQANRLAKSTDYGTQFGPSTGQFQQFAEYKAEDARRFGEQVTARLVPELKKTAHISGAAFVDAFEDEMNKLAKITQLKAEQAGQNFQRSLNEHFRIGAAPGKSARDSFAVFDEAGLTPGVKAMDQLGHSTKVARYEMINLGRQANDVIVSLASGQGILTVGLQQGSQILDVFTSSERTAGEMFKQIGSSIVSFVTNPLTLAVGITTALVTTTLALANAWDKVQVSSNRAVSGAGARTGTSIGDINAFVNRTASAGSTGLSDVEARKLGQAYTSTGDIVISKLNGMSDAVVGFANQSGKSIDEAIKDFVRFGSDPVKAMDELAKVYGPVDQGTRDLVERFVAAGDKTAALAALIAGLADKSREAAKEMGFLESVWRRITTLAGKETAAPVGAEDKLESLRLKLTEAQRVAPEHFDQGQAAADVARLTEEYQKQLQVVLKLNDASGAAIFEDIANKARIVTDALIPQNEQLKVMELQLYQLREAQAAGAGGPDLAAATQALENLVIKTREAKEETARANEETARLREKWGSVSDEANRAAEAFQQNLPVIQAIGGAAERSAQFTADIAAGLRAALDPATALLNAMVKRAEAEARSLKAIQDTTRELEEQNELAKAKDINDEKRIASAQAYNKVIKELGDNEKGREEALKRSDAVAESYRIKIKNGADHTAAAAHSSHDLANGVGSAANAAGTFAQRMQGALTALQQGANVSRLVADTLRGSYDTSGAGSYPAGSQSSYTQPQAGTGGSNSSYLSSPGQMTGGSFVNSADPAVWAAGAKYKGGGTGRVIAPSAAATAAYWNELNAKRAYDAEAAQAKVTAGMTESMALDLARAQASGDVGGELAALQAQLGYTQGLPETAAKYQQISSLQSAIENLTKQTENLVGSTDDLNATNQELLSPYYTQDPRTSHIGFRSQGMAAGGYVDVPGGYSANDNMLAMVPVASGERIYVDPMTSKRGGAGGTTINISAPMTFAGPVNRDEVGRTVYQTMQSTARSIQAASR